MQGQENRKNDILGLESSLSAEAADLLLTEDTNMVMLGIAMYSTSLPTNDYVL